MSPKRVLEVSFFQPLHEVEFGLIAFLEQIAETLYQRGILSYPRTETDQFDRDFNFNELIQKQTADNAWGAYAHGCATPVHSRSVGPH